MLNNFSSIIINNKNLLMLLSAIIYTFALVATLTGNLLPVASLVLVISIFFLIKNVFPIKYIVIWNLLFLLGVINTSLRLKDVDELLNLAPVNCEITGTVLSIPQGVNEGKPKFFFDVEKIEFGSVAKDLKNEKVLVTINSNEKYDNIKIYNSLTLTGRLSPPFKAGNPSQFDYGNYLRNHNTYAVFYAKEVKSLEKELTLKAKILQGINDYRERVIKVHSKYLPSPNLEILGGVVFGDDAISPPKEIKESFVKSGLLHILAASGMNVAFIFTFFFWIFQRLRFNYRLNIFLGMLMVITYTLMTGLGASIIRASCMLIFVLVGKLIDRDAHSISLLAFVGLLMLIYNPLFVNDIGFQLSFIVTFGILLMTQAIMRFNNKVLDYFVGIVSIPIIAQIWVIPVQIFYFSNISLYSIFANIMSVPLLAVISFGGFISSLLSAIYPLADFICAVFDFILNPIISTLVNISDFWGHLPSSTIQTTHPSIFQIALYYLMVIAIVGLLYKEIREKYFKTLLITISSILFVLLILLIPIKNSDLEITAFDVGSADCFLIKTPQNEYIMIDTGKSGYNGGKSQAEIIVLKYLKDKGIKNINTLIITHFDNDHCGGAVDVLNSLNVKTLVVNDLEHESIAANLIYKSAQENSTQILLAENGQLIYDKNGLSLINYTGLSSDNDNENSIITHLKYNNFSMLFTGDASTLGMEKVLMYLKDKITVLKVPHHGAIDGINKNVVKCLNPQYSIISVGENKFGHPSVYTLKLLADSQILRTDIDNSILVKVNKQGTKILHYDQKKRKYVKF